MFEKELVKKEDDMFTNYYEGVNGSKKVVCILDDFSVRYIVFINGKKTSRREYDNCNKNRCFEAAKKALNK